MRSFASSSTEKYELYSLRDDPLETVNLRIENKTVFLRLKKELQKFIKAGSVRLKGKRVQIDKDEKLKKQLKSLGYL